MSCTLCLCALLWLTARWQGFWVGGGWNGEVRLRCHRTVTVRGHTVTAVLYRGSFMGGGRGCDWGRVLTASILHPVQLETLVGKKKGHLWPCGVHSRTTIQDYTADGIPKHISQLSAEERCCSLSNSPLPDKKRSAKSWLMN